jgi:hypothetical protein
VSSILPERQFYRLYTIYQIPSLQYLDFVRVKPKERQRARRFMMESAAGAAVQSQVETELRQKQHLFRGDASAADSLKRERNDENLETSSKRIKTFVPGENVDDEKPKQQPLSAAEKTLVVDLLQKASNAKELDMIERAVQRGELTQIIHYFESHQQPHST